MANRAIRAALPLAIGFFLIECAGRVEGGFINFDVDSAGNPINAPIFFSQTTHLTDLYAPQGVHFRGPGGNDGGAILDQGSNFGVPALSGSNFLAFNRLTEAMMADGGHPIDPETIAFDTPQAVVSIFAAPGVFDEAEAAFGTFRMDAFDVHGMLLGTSILSSFGNYVQLSLTSTSGIASVQLTETSGDLLFVYDNLAFSTIVPEPGSLALLGIGGLISAGYLAARARRPPATGRTRTTVHSDP
jgi:PEP-CTERM motif